MRFQNHPKIFFLNLVKSCKSWSRLGGGLVFEVWPGPKRHLFRGLFGGSLDATLKNEKIKKCHQNGAQKGDFFLVLAPLGAPLAPQSVFEDKKYTQSAPKITPRVHKWHHQSAPISDPQGRKMHSYRSAKEVQVHQKMSAARYQARRTARSA